MAELHHYRDLEASTRITGGPHPDELPKLTIRGVRWHVPARGLQLQPKFTNGKVVLSSSQDPWPECDDLLRKAPVKESATCPQCGQATDATLEIEIPEDNAFLVGIFELAGRLLRQTHKLTDAQLSDLLTFDAESPRWIGQLLRWCTGQPTEAPQPTEADLLNLLASAGTADDG